jgi:hypothetical protein
MSGPDVERKQDERPSLVRLRSAQDRRARLALVASEIRLLAAADRQGRQGRLTRPVTTR